ncbi:arginine--tRNA ligase [Clostridium cylindrosporum]|uniref:Arginine--tRNA ligase n=1 Tax=Clostridium cylindrosporum DSM 605 TaxID=1121307 RepID=A0A0J8DBD4_CLOCY|nr:arginine--tRNA ligase [Clostridium cylindrosporum]KMT23142.1 arginine--tRNA ligase ArgS [Clostridium cylindrosporum DSM 605]
MDYKNILAKNLSEKTGLNLEEIEGFIEIPPKSDMGDFAFPCFRLAKTMKKAPNLIAEELKSTLNIDCVERIESLGGYLNFFIAKGNFSKEVIEKVISEKEKYGSCNIGDNKNVIVEYSSPNIAKPFHVGHLCSTAIGNSLYKILSFAGYNTIGINHLGDWGTQFGKLIVAYERWVDEKALENEPIKELLRIYIKFHDEAEKDPSLEDLARAHFKNLEDGCEKEVKLWQRIKDVSLVEFNRVYDLLNIKFDSLAGESFYSDKMESVVSEIKDKGILVESKGALVVELDEFNIPPCMIMKSDGATIYATRDLAAATYRQKTYDFYKNIYVVGTPQSLHFNQIFSTLKKMGKEWANDCVHVGFGTVRIGNKKLATRKGDVVLLEELLSESISRSLELINEKNPALDNKEDVAKKIGIGSVIFTYLKNNRERDLSFDWKDILNFDGETAPYVQYTYARGKSILKKAGDFSSTADYTKLNTTEEFELTKLISRFNETLLLSIEKYEPSIITRYIIDVAKAFNKFYNHCSIMNLEDDSLKMARLNLVVATTIVIKNGLSLLGIDTVERM